jgi:hypothetical protein
MRMHVPFLCIYFACLTVSAGRLLADAPVPFVVTPSKIELSGRFDRVQLVVTQTAVSSKDSVSSKDTDDHCQDLTAIAKYEIEGENIASVDANGTVTAKNDGTATIRVSLLGAGDTVTANIEVTVIGTPSTEVDFLKDVRPVFSKAGCAAGACHASQNGKGGFKLSVFGFDPVADYDSIAVSSRGRRVSPAQPDASLILDKSTMRVAHGGGLRLEDDSLEYEVIRQWISNGSPESKVPDLTVQQLDVFPKQRVSKLGNRQQLRVVASYPDGTQRDVTHLAMYDAIDTGILSVNKTGRVKTIGDGQSAVMVRYEGQVAVATFVVPYSQHSQLADWKNNNYIDEIAASKFVDLGLEPSGLCDDVTFVRRAFLDAVGSMPEPETVTAFIESSDPEKYSHLIDRLLGLTGDPTLDIYNDRYAAFWTLRWSDLIRNNSNSLGEQGMWAMHNWIRNSFRVNKRFDQFVQELVTAQGSIYSNGPANYFRVHADSAALTEATAQLFMGVRLECAKCHQHPFESISQSDYYSMSAFFARVASKNSEEFGLFGRETVVMVKPSGEVSHPRTGKTLEPKPLGGQPTENSLDRRIPLAKWLTSPENAYFARSVVNRYMGYLLGYGLVEPVDDMRSTNPPSNIVMLDAITKDFVDHGYDLKHLIREIMTSRLYSLSPQPTRENAADQRFYSHFNVKRLAAEPLLDAIDQATGVPTKFKSLPLGTRAIELPDAEYPDFFLNTFAKPRRVSVCECERSPDANLAQALHTLNGDTLASKIASKDGRIAKLMAANKPHEEIVREIYLATLCRPPAPTELEASREILNESANPTECYQDLLWALLNTKQFLFVR